MYVGLYTDTKISSNFTLKMGEFYCTRLFLAMVRRTDWKGARGQMGGLGLSLASIFHTALAFHCFAAGESGREELGGPGSFPSHCNTKDQLSTAVLVTISSLAGSQECDWVNRDLVYKAILLPWRPIPTKHRGVKQLIHCSLISLGLCFLVCKRKGWTISPLGTLWALTACAFKYYADLIKSFYF